jgi:hypothetical protein
VTEVTSIDPLRSPGPVGNCMLDFLHVKLAHMKYFSCIALSFLFCSLFWLLWPCILYHRLLCWKLTNCSRCVAIGKITTVRCQSGKLLHALGVRLEICIMCKFHCYSATAWQKKSKFQQNSSQLNAESEITVRPR